MTMYIDYPRAEHDKRAGPSQCDIRNASQEKFYFSMVAYSQTAAESGRSSNFDNRTRHFPDNLWSIQAGNKIGRRVATVEEDELTVTARKQLEWSQEHEH